MATQQVEVMIRAHFKIAGSNLEEIRKVLEDYSDSDIREAVVNEDNMEILTVATGEYKE